METINRPTGPDPPDPGDLIDQLVASALSRASTIGTRMPTPSEPGKEKLRLQREPLTRHSPGQPRDFAWVDPDLLDAIRAVAKAERPWPLFLHGPVGTGKTCAALCLLDYVPGGGEYFTEIGLWKRLLFAETGRLMQAGASGQVDSVVWPERIWQGIRRTWLMVLDEIGSRGSVSDALYDTTKEVLECRRNRPLVVISNFGLDALARTYDDRIASRLAAGTIVQLRGRDRRLEP